MINFDTLQKRRGRGNQLNLHDLELQQMRVIELMLEGVPVKKAVKMSKPKKVVPDLDKIMSEVKKENERQIKEYNKWKKKENLN